MSDKKFTYSASAGPEPTEAGNVYIGCAPPAMNAASPRYIPDAECAQSKCARQTTGCWGECSLKRNPVVMNAASQPDTALFEQAAKFGRKDKVDFRIPGTSRSHKVECVIMEPSDVGQFVRSLAAPVGQGSADLSDPRLVALADANRQLAEAQAQRAERRQKYGQGSATSGEAEIKPWRDRIIGGCFAAPSNPGFVHTGESAALAARDSEIADLRAALAAKAEQANTLVPPYRVAEFWSSSRPGTKVRMLAEGDDIVQWGKRGDFIRWMDAPPDQPNPAGAARQGGNTSTEDILKIVAENTGKRISLSLGDLDCYIAVVRAALARFATPVAERAAAPASVPEDPPTWVIMVRPGKVPVRKGPFREKKHIEDMLRDLYALHPGCQCIVIDMPGECYPDSGIEWIDIYGDKRRKPIREVISAAPEVAQPAAPSNNSPVGVKEKE